MNKHKKISEKRILIKDKISGNEKTIRVKTFRLPNGIIENFFIEDDRNSVQVLALTTDDDVIVVKQFRPGIERVCIELPGGAIEKGESPVEAAIRELREETGYEGICHYLGKQSYSPYSTGYRHMFVINNCQKVNNKSLDENEFLKVVKWPLEKFRNMLREGRVRGTDCAYIGLEHIGLLC